MNNLFLSNGDFIFPFQALEYIFRHFFLWSENASALSLDGVLRLFSKSETLLFFWLSDSALATGYFYIIFILAFSTFSIYLFLTKFLNVSKYPAILGTLLFIFNPAFLGNYAKIGLILSVSALPLALVCFRFFLETNKFKYLIFVILLLNLSLLHPFTFIVNVAVLAMYAGYHYREILNIKSILKIFTSSVLFVAFSLYFIFPILNIGTISKDSIHNKFTKGAEEVDYTQIVDVANTDGYANGLILSKDIFLDFEFYPENKKAIFFTSSYFLLILILTIFFLNKRMTRTENVRFLLLMGFFLIVVALSSVQTEYINKLTKWIIENLPAGWSFRSPLKWQLYAPLCLAGMLALAVHRLVKYRAFTGFMVVLSIITINGYILLEIKDKLLTPMNLGEYETFYYELTGASNLLVVRNAECIENMPKKDLSIINQILISQNAGVYNISDKVVEDVPMFSFDYILSCSNQDYIDMQFKEIKTSNNFRLYKNRFDVNEIDAFTQAFSFHENTNYQRITSFVHEEFKTDNIYFVNNKETIPNKVSILNIFEAVTPSWFKENTIVNSEIKPVNNGVLIRPNTSTSSSTSNQEASLEIISTTTALTTAREPFMNQTSYSYPKPIAKNNLIEKGSFEEGLWQDKVEDCFNYDDSPIIEMKKSQVANEGKYSLELSATRHTACTNQKFTVKSNQKYLLSFDYQSTGELNAGYYLSFEGVDGTDSDIFYTEKLSTQNDNWKTYNKIIETPVDTQTATLYLYTYQLDGINKITNRYDNVSIIELPDDLYKYWLYSDPQTNFTEPRSIEFDPINPTKKLVHIKGATTPFYLAMSESYHDNWQAQFNNEKINGFFKGWVPFVEPDIIPDEHHFELNGFLNGWYIDTEEYCKNKNLCTQNPDGSYDIELVLEFFPQRWFYLGLLISATTFMGLIGYLVFDFVRTRKERNRKREDGAIPKKLAI